MKQNREQIDQLEDHRLQRIALMMLYGFTDAEIAEALEMSEMSVARKRKAIQVLWER